MKKFSTKLVAISAALLFGIGMTVGGFCMRLFLQAYPDTVKASLHIVLQIGCGAVLGLLLAISVNPILSLGKTLFETVKKSFIYKKPLEIAGVVIGFSIGALAGYFVFEVLSIFLSIVAVKYILSVLLGLLVAFVFAAVCPKWLTDEAAEQEESYTCVGFLVDGSALSCDHCTEFLQAISLNNVFILPATVESVLREGDEKAVAALEALEQSGAVQRLKNTDTLDVEKIAISHRLKLVTARPVDGSVQLDVRTFLKSGAVPQDKELTIDKKNIKMDV